MVSSVVFSSQRSDWETPFKLFQELNDEFRFDLDPAASAKNAKCKNFFTEEDDGLAQPWFNLDKCILSVFVNPPYSRTLTGKWVEKMYKEAERGALVVALLPARTDTKWFHKYILPYENAKLHTWEAKVSTEIRFIKGRVQFEIDGKPVCDKKNRPMKAPFPSMIVIFKPLNLDCE